MIPRVLIGHLGGGAYGLRCSLPGHDVLSAPSEKLSFDSAWPNLVKIRATGVVVAARNVLTDIFYADEGYTPHFSARAFSGNVLYDDHAVGVAPGQGAPGAQGVWAMAAHRSNYQARTRLTIYNQVISPAVNVFYVLYQIPQEA